MPRIPPPASCPRPGRSTHFAPAATASASTAASSRAVTVTPFYDPMIAKLIVHGADPRGGARAQLAAACAAVEVWPVKTNAAFLARAAADPDFVAGRIDTGFIERHADRLVATDADAETVIDSAATRCFQERAMAIPGPR